MRSTSLFRVFLDGQSLAVTALRKEGGMAVGIDDAQNSDRVNRFEARQRNLAGASKTSHACAERPPSAAVRHELDTCRSK